MVTVAPQARWGALRKACEAPQPFLSHTVIPAHKSVLSQPLGNDKAAIQRPIHTDAAERFHSYLLLLSIFPQPSPSHTHKNHPTHSQSVISLSSVFSSVQYLQNTTVMFLCRVARACLTVLPGFPLSGRPHPGALFDL